MIKPVRYLDKENGPKIRIAIQWYRADHGRDVIVLSDEMMKYEKFYDVMATIHNADTIPLSQVTNMKKLRSRKLAQVECCPSDFIDADDDIAKDIDRLKESYSS